MLEKPKTAAGYDPQQTTLVLSTCLTVAVDLQDLMQHVVIVGGLAPALLVNQANLPSGADPHPGTLDLDIGLSLAIFDQERYEAVARRLKGAGFVPDVNENGNETVQRWVRESPGRVTIDFLIPPTSPQDEGGTMKNLRPGFGALITPGLELAFQDVVEIEIHGQTLDGDVAKRTIRVAGPGAFIVLKALAFHSRGEPKDAYDLFYVLRNFGAGVEDVVEHLMPLRGNVATQDALAILSQDFANPDSVGARRAARFLYAESNAAMEADVAGFVTQLLDLTEN